MTRKSLRAPPYHLGTLGVLQKEGEDSKTVELDQYKTLSPGLDDFDVTSLTFHAKSDPIADDRRVIANLLSEFWTHVSCGLEENRLVQERNASIKFVFQVTAQPQIFASTP